MQAAARALHEAGVERVLILHGTFAGTDAVGLLSEVARWFPQASEGLRRISKRLVDALMRDNGNYTPAYAEHFGTALKAAGAPDGCVRLLDWTGENHHLGRAHGAVRLVDELLRLNVAPDRRVLLWGHSHGGNVAALACRLLAGERCEVDAFFRACGCYYRRLWFGEAESAVWRRVEQMLYERPRPAIPYRLDIATFGTPLRYGWCEAAADHIVHFVHHRPVAGLPPCRAAPPAGISDVLNAAGGDYVQQGGIAGTNIPPPLWIFRAWLADRRLNALLQPPELSYRNLLARIAAGVRTAETGRTLLVDYGPPHGGIEEHLAGHAVYTRPERLPFHMLETARELREPVADATQPCAEFSPPA